MRINYLGPPPYLNLFENGSILSNESISVDCADAQQDVTTVIDIGIDDGEIVFGIDSKNCSYAANIIIPGKQFVINIATSEGEEYEEVVAIPLDMNQVVVNLWTIPVKTMEEV